MIEHLVHFNSKKIFIFLSLFALTQISAQVYPDKLVHNTLKSGIKLIVEQKYNDAQILFDQFDKSRSDLPIGKIYLAATQIAKCFDYQEPFNDELITQYLESAKNISESLLNKDDKNIWYNYFFALTQGYIAYYDALKGDWLSAFSNGLISVRAFDYCLELDQNFYESFIAIGNYKFWRSKKTEFLNWLPFVPDEKELGIDYLKKAVNQSGYNSHLAIHSLIWIYIEQEEYSKVIEIADSALKRNPQSRLFKWGLARAYENVEPVKAVALYGEILLSYPTDLISNKINKVTLKHLIAQQEAKLGKKQQALDLCNEILGIKGYNDFELSKLNNRLGRVRDLKNELMLK